MPQVPISGKAGKRCSKKYNATTCVKDCGLHNENIDMIILFACLVGWHDSLPVETK